MKMWDVFVNDHFLGTIAAADGEDVLEVACFVFGRYLSGLLSVYVRSDQSRMFVYR